MRRIGDLNAYDIKGLTEKEWNYISASCGVVMWINVKDMNDLNYSKTHGLMKLEHKVRKTLSRAKESAQPKIDEVVWSLYKIINFGVNALNDA